MRQKAFIIEDDGTTYRYAASRRGACEPAGEGEPSIDGDRLPKSSAGDRRDA